MATHPLLASSVLAVLVAAAYHLSLPRLALDFVLDNIVHGFFPDLGWSLSLWLSTLAFTFATPLAAKAGAPQPLVLLIGALGMPGAIVGTAFIIEALPVLLPAGAGLGLVAVVGKPSLLAGASRKRRKTKRSD